MDLSTNYLGLKLANPFMPGASPLIDNLDVVKQLEDAGAAAIVMHSLFEEQISGERLATIYQMEMYADAYAEALSYFPKPDEFRMGPDEYLERIRQIKACTKLPVIGSLNGTTAGGWMDYARLIAQAGADALELNVYYMPTAPTDSAASVEARIVDVLKEVKKATTIPVAVKLSPFFSALSNLASQLDENGANGLVLFNRFYQPDIDLENLEPLSTLRLSDSSELLLRLRWLAILSCHLQTSLAVSGGVHCAQDAIKAIMCGANAVQIVSALLEKGPKELGKVLADTKRWMEEHEYESIKQMCGSMNMTHSPDPTAFERGNYMRILQTWKPTTA